jgi:chromosome segregation ATPase
LIVLERRKKKLQHRIKIKMSASTSAEALLKHASDELALVDKFLGDQVTSDLALLLRHDVRVRRITLKGNCIGQQGAMSLASMLENNTTIQSLSLEWNQIGSAGASAIAAALGKNRSLTSLDLRNNGITDEGAISLATALRLNETLTNLDLRWNVIGDKGVLPFDEILSKQDGTPIPSIQLSGNVVSASAMGRLDGIIQNVQDLQQLKSYDPVANADAHVAKARIPILQKDVSDLQQHLEVAKAQREELQRQLNSSALTVTELEQQVLREQYKTKQADVDLEVAKTRIAELADETRVLTRSWDSERAEMMSRAQRDVREKEVEIRSLLAERDGLIERAKKAEEETKRIAFSMEQAADRAESQKVELTDEIRKSLSQFSDLSATKSALEHENKYLKDISDRATDRAVALETELAAFRQDATTKLKNEVMRAESEVARLRTEHKAELADLAELTTKQGKEIATLQGELSEANGRMASLHVDSSLERDRAVTAARETEQLRSKNTITDLQEKVNAFMKFRTELEARCQSYIKELSDLQESSSRENSSINEQLQFTQGENERLRNAVRDADSKIASITTERTNLEVNLRDKTAAMDEAQSKERKWHRMCEEATAKNQRLTDMVATLNSKVRDLESSRSDDFSKMKARVSQVVQKEFDLLQVSMRVHTDTENVEPDKGTTL